MKKLIGFEIPTRNENKSRLMAMVLLYFSDSSFVYTKLHGHSRKKLKKISKFFGWLLSYISSPEQKIGFLIQLLKKPGQANVELNMEEFKILSSRCGAQHGGVQDVELNKGEFNMESSPVIIVLRKTLFTCK